MARKSNSVFKVITLLVCLFILIKFGHFSSVETSEKNARQTEPNQRNHQPISQALPRNQTHQIDRNYPINPANQKANQKDALPNDASSSNNAALPKDTIQPKDTAALTNDADADSNEPINQTEAKNLLKDYLLRKLDLSQPANLADTKVPGFLLDIFEMKSFESNSFKVHKKNRVLLINNSNTIRSHPIVEQRRRQKSKRNKSGYLIKYNMTLSARETLNAGEFRLFLNRSNGCSTKKQRITINQILQRPSSTSSKRPHNNHYTTVLEEANLIYREIDTLIAFYDKPKWLQFDVLPAVESWLKNSSSNFGLLIKSFCVDRNEIALNEHKFVDNFIIQAPNPDVIDDFMLEEWDNFKPILLSYSNHHALGYDNDSWKDSLDFMNKKKRAVEQDQPDYSTAATNSDWKSGRTKDCARYSMYVDFKELGWDQWIVTPDGYDAHVCYGDCSLSAVRKDQNASNHATAQALSNSIQPNLVPPPCCVPSEFSPLLLVYKDGDASIVRIYEDMIVTSCACR